MCIISSILIVTVPVTTSVAIATFVVPEPLYLYQKNFLCIDWCITTTTIFIFIIMQPSFQHHYHCLHTYSTVSISINYYSAMYISVVKYNSAVFIPVIPHFNSPSPNHHHHIHYHRTIIAEAPLFLYPSSKYHFWKIHCCTSTDAAIITCWGEILMDALDNEPKRGILLTSYCSLTPQMKF